MGSKVLTIVIAMALFLGITEIGLAQRAKENIVKHTTTGKEVVGEIIWMNDKYIAVLYQRDPQTGDEYEILLPWNKKSIGLEHLRSVGEVQKGDIVRVKYEEDYTLYDTKREDVRRRAKVIGFVRKGTPKPVAVEPQGEGVLKSEAQE
jgi:hypothetical protein